MARSRGIGGVLGWAFTHTLLLAAAVLAASFVPAARQAAPQLGAVHTAAVEAWALLAPGGTWHPATFIEHKGHLVVEASLLVVISFLLLQGTFRPSKDEEEPLTERVRRYAAGCWCCRECRLLLWPRADSAAELDVAVVRVCLPRIKAVGTAPSSSPSCPTPCMPVPPHSNACLPACLQEIDELCDEWEPEPLYPPVSAVQAGWKEPVISSQTGTQVGD